MTFWTLQRTAQSLGRRNGGGKGLPALLFFTDPERTPDPEAVAAALPRGSAVVFRPFGASDAVARAGRLRSIARARGLVLLIGADPALAARVGADGVHLPERMAHRARALKAARPGWIVTAAAHSLPALRRARGADAAVLSAAFPSASPSAPRALGPARLAALVRAGGVRTYGLGGVNMKTARRLLASGLVGLAAVEGFRT